MFQVEDFLIHDIKNKYQLQSLKNNAPIQPGRFFPYPFTYIFVSLVDKHLIKVGRSSNPYLRLCEFNQHTRKYLGGMEFQASVVVQSPMFLENHVKYALLGHEYKVDSRIDGSTEVYHLKNYQYKRPITIVNKVIRGLCA